MVGVTVMCVPCTIWAWQEAQRSFSPRRWAALDQTAQRFYRGAVGLIYLPRLIPTGREMLDPCAAGIVYYARQRSLALDVQLLLERLRRR